MQTSTHSKPCESQPYTLPLLSKHSLHNIHCYNIQNTTFDCVLLSVFLHYPHTYIKIFLQITFPGLHLPFLAKTDSSTKLTYSQFSPDYIKHVVSPIRLFNT